MDNAETEVRLLDDKGQFPVAIETREKPEVPSDRARAVKLSAHDFARDTGSYGFGMDVAKTVATLRSLADRIEAREILVIRAQVITEAGRNEFTLGAFVLEFAEKDPFGAPISQ
jgi:hypothetical protein